jgi:hypothetical protein
VTVKLENLPKVIILEPGQGVRVDLRMDSPACEFEFRLAREAPGRSFILMIGHKNGEFVQRVRVAGHTKIYFNPETPGEYVVVLTNPMGEPAVVHCEARAVPAQPVVRPRYPDYDPAFR